MLLLRRVRVGVAAPAAATKPALECGAQAGVPLGGKPLLWEALRWETLQLPARQRLLLLPGPAGRNTLLRVLTGSGLAGLKCCVQVMPHSRIAGGRSKEARVDSSLDSSGAPSHPGLAAKSAPET